MIDAHHHLWSLSRADCTWPTPDLRAIYRDFEFDDYKKARAETGIRGSVLVQTQPCDSDTDFLLEIAHAEKDILAVVGWVDLASKAAVQRIEQLSKQQKLRALRPMLQSIEDSEWILRAELQPAIAAMHDLGLGFDALVQPRHVEVMNEFAARYPQLQIVIDHGAKPDIEGSQITEWAQGISRLATKNNVFCKVSGLVTEASLTQVESQEAFVPYIRHLFESFGAQYLMWGSDWPVVNLATSLVAWQKIAHNILLDCGANKEDLKKIFFGTACHFYRIEENQFEAGIK